MGETDGASQDLGIADGITRPVLPLIEHIYTEPQAEVVRQWLNHVGIATANAREAGVDEPRISQRLTQLLHAREYAALTFLLLHDDEFNMVTESWIGARIRDQIEYDPKKAVVHTVIPTAVQAIMDTPPTKTLASHVFSAVSRLSVSTPLDTFAAFLPSPFKEGTPTVVFGGRIMPDRSRPISIHGYDRSAAGLRWVMGDMKKKREQSWTPDAGEDDELISCASWLFATSDHVERMLGEPMSRLEQKGLKWIGAIDILNPAAIDPTRLAPVTFPGAVVGSAVYGVALRDSYVTQFMVEGKYPQVGAFTMPRSTFQNLNQPHS